MQSEEHKREKKKRNKLLFVVILILVIIGVLITFYIIGNNKYAPEHTIEAFDSAVKKEDAKELTKLLYPYNDSFEITEENTAKFIAYLKEHPDIRDAMIKRLENQTENIQSSKKENNDADDKYGTVNIYQKGKKWILFDDYEITVVPATIDVDTNNKDVDIFVDDEKVATTPSENEVDQETTDENYSFGPYMPGTYTVKAVYDNTYASIEEKKEVEIINLSEQQVTNSFDLPLEEIEIKSRFEDFNLYVNDKKTDIMVDAGKQSIGTFPFDGSVKLDIRKEYPWGEVKSNTETVNDDYIVFNSINALSEEDEEALMEQINDTINQYNVALTKDDTSLIKDGVTDNMKKVFEDKIKEIKKKKPKYKSKLVRAVYRIEDTIPEYNDDLGGYTLTFKAHYTTHEPTHKGFFDWQSRDEDKKEYTRARNVTVFYDEGAKEWKLDKCEKDYFVITSNEEKVFEYAKNKKKKQ